MHRTIGEGIILDPFLGSGTTAIAAIELGREWIGIERSEIYCKSARERIETAISRTKASPQPERESHRREIYSESEPAGVSPEEIAESLMADPNNSAAVWRALGGRLASSMSVLFLAWYGIPIPDNPLLFPACPLG
jgi:hypothetical protein